MSYPKTLTWPAAASTNDERILISVDLPEPLAPMSPNTAPDAISNETFSTARTRRRGAADHGRRWPGVKILVTSRTTSGRLASAPAPVVARGERWERDMQQSFA